MKLGIFCTHPVQYQVPLWRRLGRALNWDICVFYFSDQGLSEKKDPGFGQIVAWDLPLLDGYRYKFITKRNIESAGSFRIPFVDQLMEREKFDLILLNGYTHRFARQIIRRKHKFGYKVMLRGEFTDMPRRVIDWKKLPRRFYLKWFYRHVDHFCPIGVDAVDHLKRFEIKDHDMTLVPYTVDDQLFDSAKNMLLKDQCRRSLGIVGDELVFLFSGKMISRKQPSLLAKAVLKLRRDYPNIAVIYVGSGPQYTEVKRLLSSTLGSQLIAPGFVNQSKLGMYFKASDVFVLPSKFDTWGLVVNEAMHFGLPCIVSDRVGSRQDLIKHGVTGWIFDHRKVDDLTLFMRKFLDEPPLAERMGKNALEHIKDFTIDKAVQRLESAISKTV